MTQTIILFDVDGVLITPHGYRKACDSTMKVFLDQLGQPHWLPDLLLYEQFESHMITSEWDMIPLLLCAFLEHAANILQPSESWTNFDYAAADIRSVPNLPHPMDLAGTIDQIGKIVNGQSGTPSGWVLKTKNEDRFPFPMLRNHPVLEYLLNDTRHIENSLTMRVFQEHIIGSKLFEEYYGLQAQHNAVNYLTEYDVCPVTAETKTLLNQKSEAGEIYLSLYTARPSMPPAGIPSNGDGAYSPEAEQALDLIPLSKIYMSAYGKVHWLSQHCDFDSEELLKPSPVQALSAISYHFVDDEVKALMWAQEVYRAYLDGDISEVHTASHLPRSIMLHVFEDSPNGLRGGVQAAEILRFFGIKVNLHLYGISDNPTKQAALRAQGGQVFEDVNEAIQIALS